MRVNNAEVNFTPTSVFFNERSEKPIIRIDIGTANHVKNKINRRNY